MMLVHSLRRYSTFTIIIIIIGFYAYYNIRPLEKYSYVHRISNTIPVKVATKHPSKVATKHQTIPVKLATKHPSKVATKHQTIPVKLATKHHNKAINRQSCVYVMRDYNIFKSNYVMALSYREQLSMATNSLSALVNLARGWHSRVVTPFTHNSELYGLPSTDNYPDIDGMTTSINEGPTKPLSLLYDMNRLNNDLFCDQYYLPPLVSFEEFLMNANRQIILLHINLYNNPPKNTFIGMNYTNCMHYETIQSTSLQLLKSLHIETKKRRILPFMLDSACCLLLDHVTHTPMEIAEGCGFSKTEKITIIFTVWRGYEYKPTHAFRLLISDSPIFNVPTAKNDAYPLSQDIINNASAFANHLSCNSSRQFVGIHLRTAKLALLGGAHQAIESCLDATTTLLKNLNQYISHLQDTLYTYKNCHRYFVDYGEFGSHSYRIKAGKHVSEKILSKRQIEPVHYDPRKYGGKLDQGYVASVEQLAIAHSNVLILVGRGGFQDQILSRFIDRGLGSIAFRVCETKKKQEAKVVYINKTLGHVIIPE